MTDLIQIDKSPVKEALRILLQDKTTGENIIFATDMYSSYGYRECHQMTETAILGFDSCDIQPRVLKAQSEQSVRTRKKAEVFTPTWICNQMNNHCDDEWFGSENIFNKQDGQTRQTTSEPVPFENEKAWQKYVDSRRLEITCGEAPYIVSRYDATTGEPIPVADRIGVLDRKMRVVNENTETEEMWYKWTIRAFQSVYGYEFQGDNLLIARINLLVTFCDYLYEKWKREATKKEIQKIANIIAWNFWQMDGLTDKIPVGFPEENYHQLSLFDDDDTEEKEKTVDCKIYDWRKDISKVFRKIKAKKESGVNMKFDFVIGNPPYQEEQISNDIESSQKNFAPSIYNLFMDASFEVSDRVELIHPARFLFNAGNTPKLWNEKMLNDEHFKVLSYEQDSNKIFPTLSSPLKGGVAITYRDSTKKFGAIKTFTQYPTVNSVMHKTIDKDNFISLSEIIYSRTAYRLTDKLHSDYPEAIKYLSNGHAYDMSSNIFERLPFVFLNEKPDDDYEYIKIIGRENSKRVYKYIRRDYVNGIANTYYYKVLVPQANGSGVFGETMSPTVVEGPNVGNTETFISIGKTNTEQEALSIQKYIYTKFARTLLGILKVTQNGNKPVWKYVPLQDFTENSDIDWSKSVAEIDRQLYAKYGLSQEEIDFIESHVKEMT